MRSSEAITRRFGGVTGHSSYCGEKIIIVAESSRQAKASINGKWTTGQQLFNQSQHKEDIPFLSSLLYLIVNAEENAKSLGY